MFNKERLLNFKKYLILKAANGTILDNMIGAIDDPYKVTKTATPKVEEIKFTDPELINPTESTTSTTTTTVDPEDARQSMLASRRRGASTTSSTSDSSSSTTVSGELPVDVSASTYTDPKLFASDMYNYFKTNGYKGAKALTSLVALETGWGAHMAGNFNYGNITAGSQWTGQKSVRKDNSNGKLYTFRSYSDKETGLKDHENLLSTVYGITKDDDDNTIVAKLTGQNAKGRKWAEAIDYADRILELIPSLDKKLS